MAATYQRIVPGVTLSAVDLHAYRLRRELAKIVNGQILKTYKALIRPNGFGPAPRRDEFPVDWLAKHGNADDSVHRHEKSSARDSDRLLCLRVASRHADCRPALDEPTVLRIGAAYETAAGLTGKRPVLDGVIAVQQLTFPSPANPGH